MVDINYNNKKDVNTYSKEELIKRLNWFEKKYGPYIEKRGIHNWRNLFKKPTVQEWTILFMLILMFFLTLAYQRDIALCQEIIKNYNEGFTKDFNFSSIYESQNYDIFNEEMKIENGT